MHPDQHDAEVRRAARMTQIDEMAAAAVARFITTPQYSEAVQAGWEPQLLAYAKTAARYQAILLTRTRTDNTILEVPVDDIFGAGFGASLDAGNAADAYTYQQWHRTQHAECAHGIVTIRVPVEHARRMVADAVAAQNGAAARSAGV